MPRKGENIGKRKDGLWEARYIKGRELDGRIQYRYVYASKYALIKKETKPDSRCYFDVESGSHHPNFHRMAGKSSIFSQVKQLLLLRHHHFYPSISLFSTDIASKAFRKPHSTYLWLYDGMRSLLFRYQLS